MATALSVDFSNEVRDWIAQNLARGCMPASVVRQLAGHGVEAELAAGMVKAVSDALLYGSPLPDGRLQLDGPEPHYRSEPSRLPVGSWVRAGSRTVPVVARFEQPRIALLGEVLDAAECDALIAAARSRLRSSTVVDPVSGHDAVTDARRSEGMFFGLMETPLVEQLDRRIAELMGQPVQHGEGLQVLRYPTGAESTPHFDFLMPAHAANRESIARSGQRISTLIVYLNDVAAGGETTFPHLGLSITPRRGHALYFEYTNSLGQTDPLSLHAGAPVLRGEKWIVTKWMRARRFVSALH